MGLTNTTSTYGFISKFFHWIMALMLITAWIMGLFHDDVGSLKRTFVIAHYTLGISVFLLVGFRLGWRLLNPTPAHVLKNKMLNIISNTTFAFFYSLMFLVPASGYVMMNFRGKNPVFFGYEIPALFQNNQSLKELATDTYELLTTLLLVLVILHVAAALFHHFIRKDPTLKRMLLSK